MGFEVVSFQEYRDGKHLGGYDEAHDKEVPILTRGGVVALVLASLFGFSRQGVPPVSPADTGDRVEAQAQRQLRDGPITTVSGQIILTDTLAGRVILVNAWATWCGPCVLEMPAFQRVQDDFEGRGFLVLGISADREGPEFVQAFLDELGITYPVTVGPQHPLGRLAAQVRGLPTSFLLARDGRLAEKVEGVFREEALREAVEVLLGEDPPGG